MYDLVMAALHGARARLLGEWEALLRGAGFEVRGTWSMRVSTGQVVFECVPVEAPSEW
jgi:hypothetical protein